MAQAAAPRSQLDKAHVSILREPEPAAATIVFSSTAPARPLITPEAVLAAAAPQLPLLALETPPRVYTDHIAADEAVLELVQELEGKVGGTRCVAADCEWSGPQADGADVVQLATPGGVAHVFHVARMRHWPMALRQLLEDESISKVGNCLWVDRGRLKHNGVALSPVLDLAKMAFERGVIERKQGKLDVLVAAVLGRSLPKGAVRTSNWKAPLDDDQLVYAALDAHASALVYAKLRDAPIIRDADSDNRRDSPDGVEATAHAAAAKRIAAASTQARRAENQKRKMAEGTKSITAFFGKKKAKGE